MTIPRGPKVQPWRALVVALFVGLAGCAGAALEQRVRDAHIDLVHARDAGAYKCAPRELARGELNVEFAENELRQGDYYRAKDHVELAETYAGETWRLVRACAKPEVPLPKPTPADRDGDGIVDDADRCPKHAEDKDGFEDDDGCPENDNDKDGILDEADKCANEPEDKDGFEDEDGCPDPDNDHDAVADATDRCPRDPEDKDGFEDEDGCPDPDNDKDGVADAADKCPNESGPVGNGGCPQKFSLITVTKEKIELRQTIYFKTNKAVIESRSYPLLEEIASALKARPTMRVRIEGHTDSRGKRAKNVLLSQQRADSVRAHLIGLGISPDRMEAKGFGPDQPIETNRTVAGRERNRRVEFVITQQ